MNTCFYCCSKVNLSHTCTYVPSGGISIPFALNAYDIALLPSVVKQLESNITTTPKHVLEAITADVLVCTTELQHLQTDGSLKGSSSLFHAIKIQKEVKLILSF